MKKSKPERKDGHKLFGQGLGCYTEKLMVLSIQYSEQDSDGFKGYVRMDINHFEEFVHLLSPFLQKQDTNMRECISPEERCCVTLGYLASGKSFRSLQYQF